MMELTVTREIAPSAKIAVDAIVELYCVVGEGVSIGRRSRLGRRVSVLAQTTIGADNVIADGCVLGGAPQDIKYAGELSLLVIGDRNFFGRCVTAHIGTKAGGSLTRIGNDNTLADNSHVAHDCYVDEGVRLGRNVLLAGHVHVESGAVVDDFAAAHHFTTIGRYARVRPRTPIRRDVPPYTLFGTENSDWKPAAVGGIHDEGIRAAKLSPADEKDLRRALRELFSDESALQTKIENLIGAGAEGEVAELCEFCLRSLRGVYGRYRELLRGKIPPEAVEYFSSHPGA